MKKTKRLTIALSDFLIGLLFTLLFISIGVYLSVHFRPLYYWDVDYLHIEEYSGFEKAVILENYDTLIDYCSPFYSGELDFPSIPQSVNATIHFAEVKNIFNFFFYCGILCFAALFLILLTKHSHQKSIRGFRKQKSNRYLLVSSITTLVLPLLVGAGCALNFEQAFELFHKLFFRNDYWLFDPATDPIILMLPNTFFLHCALVIIFFVFLGSTVLFLVYRHNERKSARL
ncbi:TIGR01906 family membrane protein [Anaeromicropila populeti]|uniref:Integral membrane protein TIGR01906 n=1 Tax=Anaeromicropila populeti TaxID=37658 RepID=A0A1I6J9W4_9FIRM|nr:TIGR01906 family membrane protein [Anaeromicropila populeti]SFR75749.1 integral membrane protein TIGR01906 [Anaeromicropila populeti]